MTLQVDGLERSNRNIHAEIDASWNSETRLFEALRKRLPIGAYSVTALYTPLILLHRFEVGVGGGMIRLEVDDLHCALEDFGEPWPTPSTPSHGAAG